MVERVKAYHHHTSDHVTHWLVLVLGTFELNTLDLRPFEPSSKLLGLAFDVSFVWGKAWVVHAIFPATLVSHYLVSTDR
ncbi:hypothetical protein D3C80_1783910 [compost metagenome]